MAIANYGLKSGGTPSPQDVTDQLEANANILMDVAQGMVNGVQGMLNANAQLLARVDSRIRRSVQGLIARNVALLSPIGEGMFSSVYNAVAEVQGALDLISGKAVAPPAPAGGEVSSTATPFPLAPSGPTALPGAGGALPAAGSAPVPVAGAPPGVPGVFPGTFLVLINCRIRELAAVPEPDAATLAQLEGEGWCPWGPEPRIYCSDPTACQGILEQLRDQALQACVDWQNSGQPCPTLG